jgi:hypothetical protein
MSSKAAATETKAPKPRSSGRLGDLLGFSVVSVITRLGMAGVTIPHALAILKANKVKAATGTVAQNIRAGKNGQGRPATITKEQLQALIGSAPAPEPKAKAKASKATVKPTSKPRKRSRTSRKASGEAKGQADTAKPQGEAPAASPEA